MRSQQMLALCVHVPAMSHMLTMLIQVLALCILRACHACEVACADGVAARRARANHTGTAALEPLFGQVFTTANENNWNSVCMTNYVLTLSVRREQG